LVRHAQATPFEDVTDRLSALGEAQSRRLGEFWMRLGVVFDEVYTGSLVRQRRTAELAGWADAEILPELNEYDAESVIKCLAPQLAAKDPEFRKLAEANSGDDPERNRRFQRMFEPLMLRWIAGELDSPQVESWRDFRERVGRGLQRMTRDGARGRRVAAFTSGGPIGVAVQIALQAPDGIGLELNWRVRNCSLTELLFSGGRLSLDSFNAVPHLDDPALRTFR
jgi:broad specificity phosphatase PhoE